RCRGAVPARAWMGIGLPPGTATSTLRGMRWGHRALLAPVAVLAALAPGVPSVAAKPLLGTVQRGWISKVEPGTATPTVKPSQKMLYANFVWKRAPSPSLPLEMRWVSPQGFVRAAWK